MSIFIGTQLTRLLDQLEARVKEGKMSPDEKTDLKLRIGKIPEILLDNTDRNRTSPFAFTGNKFEFRAVGSSANCAGPMTVMNAIMAKQLQEFKLEVDAIIKGGTKRDEAILKVLRTYIIDSKAIRFEGNGYSDEWVVEAAKRGLSNINTTPPALGAYLHEKSVAMFEELDVLRRHELEARHEINLENYHKKVQIESRVMGDLSLNWVIPAALKYQNLLIENVRGLKDIGGKDYEKLAKTQLGLIREISERVDSIMTNVTEMIAARKAANMLEDTEALATDYCNKVVPYFALIRYEVDKLELIIDDDLWPLPKYRELLFTR